MSQIESLLQVRSKPRSRRKWLQPDFNNRELHGEAPRRQLRSKSVGQSLQKVTVIVMKPSDGLPCCAIAHQSKQYRIPSVDVFILECWESKQFIFRIDSPTIPKARGAMAADPGSGNRRWRTAFSMKIYVLFLGGKAAFSNYLQAGCHIKATLYPWIIHPCPGILSYIPSPPHLFPLLSPSSSSCPALPLLFIIP